MIDRARPLSPHFALGDLLVDAHFPELAAALVPDPTVIENLERLTRSLEALVARFPPGVAILSGYRDRVLNDSLRSAGLPASERSLHLAGCAADITFLDRTLDLEGVYQWLDRAGAEIDIHEAVYYPLKGFIHVAVSDPARPTPKRVLVRV